MSLNTPVLQPSQTIQDPRTSENERKEVSPAKQASIISTINDFAHTFSLISFSSTAENKAQIKIGIERVSAFLETVPPAPNSGPLEPLINLVKKVVALSSNKTVNFQDQKRRQEVLAEIILLTETPSFSKTCNRL